MVTLNLILIVSLLITTYYLYPKRKKDEYETYLSILSIFENQSNALIAVCIEQSKAVDTVLQSKITKKQYNDLLEATYKEVISHVPEYVENEVMRFLSKDEVQKLLLYKINLGFMEKYANIVIPENEDLYEYDDNKTIDDNRLSEMSNSIPRSIELNPNTNRQ